MDYAANLVSIACIAADGFDRVYTVSVNEITRFGGFIKIYRASLDGSQVPTLQRTFGNISLCSPRCLSPQRRLPEYMWARSQNACTWCSAWCSALA